MVKASEKKGKMPTSIKLTVSALTTAAGITYAATPPE
jgi:hypothetical protein